MKLKNRLFFWMISISIITALLSACNVQAPRHLTSPFTSLTPQPSLASTPAPLKRFGIDLGRKLPSDFDSFGFASMRFGWYVDYKVNPLAPTPYGMEYMPLIRVKQLKRLGSSSTECCAGCAYQMPYRYTTSPGKRQIRNTARKHPGLTWLIGNEMDRIDFGSGTCTRQDEMLPELYAQVYHDLYTVIKSADKTARVAIGGMSEFTPLRSQYLQRVWIEYSRRYGRTMPVDVWNIHLYVLQEVKDSYGADIPAGFTETQGEQYTILDNKDFSKAWAQIVSLRTWMKEHGQQDKPLIISEYGVTFPAWVDNSCPAYPDTTGCPFSAEQVRDSFMIPSFDAFLNRTDADLGYPADGNRLVQRWAWFSLDYDDGDCETGVFYEYFNGALFHSGRGPSKPPKDCPYDALGISSLGTYWMQYVQKLP